ncbi:MAG: DUF1566 domain-containing protein, partial [Proteobacteria bacterium]|nr:DUF1566 domain-containing protein [Pseudomonadota bacterium]
FAWYQLFQDGTQFTDAQGIIPKLASNVNYSKSQKHVGSEFASLPMHIFKVRAFPPATGTAPQPSLVTSVRENSDCSTKAVNCQVGDKGPAGGIIVYDAGPKSTGGRYYEIAPQACELSGLAFGKPALGAAYLSAAMRLAGKAIGAGAANSARLLATRKSPAVVAVANSTCGGFVDWFLPSKDELNEAFRQLSHSRKGLNLTPVGGFQRGYYWTSSDYNGSTAWTQYFADGQQFDRVQTLTGNKQPPARPFMISCQYFSPLVSLMGVGVFRSHYRTTMICPKWYLFLPRLLILAWCQILPVRGKAVALIACDSLAAALKIPLLISESSALRRAS